MQREDLSSKESLVWQCISVFLALDGWGQADSWSLLSRPRGLVSYRVRKRLSQKIRWRAKEMAQCLKCLPSKHEDLSWTTRTHIKTRSRP